MGTVPILTLILTSTPNPRTDAIIERRTQRRTKDSTGRPSHRQPTGSLGRRSGREFEEHADPVADEGHVSPIKFDPDRVAAASLRDLKGGA